MESKRIDAFDEEHLLCSVRQKNWRVLSQRQKPPLVQWMGQRYRPTLEELRELCLHLGQLDKALIPLPDALTSFIRGVGRKHPLFRWLLLNISADLEQGLLLSQSLRHYPRGFSPLFVEFMEAAEKTGDYAASFQRLQKHLGWQLQLRQNIRRALRYPLLLLAVIGTLFVSGVHFFLPSLQAFLEAGPSGVSQKIPWITIALLKTVSFWQKWGIFCGIIGILGGSILAGLRTISFPLRRGLSWVRLALPVLGPLLKELDLTYSLYIFGILYTAKVPLAKALEQGEKALQSPYLREKVAKVHQDILAGTPLSLAHEKAGFFSLRTVRLLRLGEETGQLGPLLEKGLEAHLEGLLKKIEDLSFWVHPLALLLLGGMIVWLVTALMSPLYNHLM